MTEQNQEILNDVSYGTAGDTSGGSSGSLSPALVWLTIRRWWLVCVPIGVVLAGLGSAVLWFTFEPVYESVGYLRIESNSPYIAYPTDQRSSGGSEDRTVRTQVELLRSPIVLERVLEREKIAAMPAIRAMGNPVRDLSKKIKAKSENDSELYSVTYSAADPNDACNVVNAVLEEYIKHQETEMKGRNEFLIQLLQLETDQRKTELTAKRNQVRELAINVPGALARPEAGSDQSIEQTQANEWAAQLASSEVERAVLNATIVVLKQTMQGEEVQIPENVLDEAVANDPEVQQLTFELQQDKIAMAGIREGSSLAAQHRKKIDDKERKLKEKEARLRDELRISALRRDKASRSQSSSNKIAELEANIKANEGMAAYYNEKLNAYRARLQSSGNKAVELEFAQRDLIRAEEVYDRLSQRINELRTETRAPARITLMKQALPPNSPVELVPWKQIMALSLATLCLPFGLALLWEFRSQRVAGVGQIQDSMNLPILAEVTCLPRYPRLTNRQATIAYDSQRAAFENSIHYLCRSLLLSAEQSDSRIFAVTSAVSGEGKTNLASVLSISMALGAHEPVLLIDADMRRPDAHAMFDVELSPGLADVLTGTCEDADAIRSTMSDGVYVLPAGRLGAHPHSVLRPDRFAAILNRLRNQYRYIIVDTPPVLSVGETLSVCKLVDGVIMCAMRDVSLRPQVEEAYSRLDGAGARMFGVVLNGVSIKTYASRYGDYYYSPHKAR